MTAGVLEVCHSCSDTYHLKCIPNQGSGCPTCNAQASNIKNIVGANSVSSASSMELIKRYLAPTSDKNGEIYIIHVWIIITIQNKNWVSIHMCILILVKIIGISAITVITFSDYLSWTEMFYNLLLMRRDIFICF